MSRDVTPRQAMRLTVENTRPAAIFQGLLFARSLGPGLLAEGTQRRNFSGKEMLPSVFTVTSWFSEVQA